MRFPLLLSACCLLSGCVAPPAPSAPEIVEGKNFYDIRFETLPGDWENLVKEDPGSWNFNFRPYGRTEDLVSDPAMVRDIARGGLGDGKAKPTGIRVSCDENGWTYLVFCGEPDIAGALAATNALPLPALEIFFLRDDTDNEKPANYFQFCYGDGQLRQFDFLPQDRHWRLLMPYVRHELRRVTNGYVFRLDIPWEAFWDRLPFDGRADNLWRLQVIRWSDGGRTWGGEVHEPARAGYVRWPDFTLARKAAIWQRLLEKGWTHFRNLASQPDYNVTAKGFAYGRAPFVRNEPYALAQLVAEGPRTYVNYAEDLAFRPALERLVAARQALGPEIAAFATRPPDEQAETYRRAADMLYNFRYAVEAAYAKHLKEKLLK